MARAVRRANFIGASVGSGATTPASSREHRSEPTSRTAPSASRVETTAARDPGFLSNCAGQGLPARGAGGERPWAEGWPPSREEGFDLVITPGTGVGSALHLNGLRVPQVSLDRYRQGPHMPYQTT